MLLHPLQFARVYTPLVLLMCLAMAALPWLLLSDAAVQRVRQQWQRLFATVGGSGKCVKHAAADCVLYLSCTAA